MDYLGLQPYLRMLLAALEPAGRCLRETKHLLARLCVGGHLLAREPFYARRDLVRFFQGPTGCWVGLKYFPCSFPAHKTYCRQTLPSGKPWYLRQSFQTPDLSNKVLTEIRLTFDSAAANVPTAIGILGSTFPPGKAKTYAISLYSAGFPLGSVIGNILGGILGQYAGWQWVFWVMAIIAFIITVAGYFAIPTPKTSASTSNPQSLSRLVDWIGGALITLAILALLAALTEGNIVGWSTPYIPVLIVISAVLTAMFIYWQYHQERGGLLRTIFCFRALRKHQLPHTSFANPSIPAMPRRPLIKPSIFRNNPRLALAQLIQALSFGAFNNFLIFATFIYQNHQHLDPIQTTLRFIPTGVSGLLTVLFTSYVLSRIPVFFILTPGCAGIATSCLLFAAPIPDGTTYWAYGFPAMCLSVLGVDTVYPCLTLYTIQNLDEEDQAMGGGIVNVLGQMGRALGLAIATAVQVAVERDRLAKGNGGSLVPERESASAAAQLAGYRAANYTGFAFAIAAVFIAIASFWGAGVVGKK